MKKIITYVMSAAVCAFAGNLASCSPDSHDTPSASVSPEDLVEGYAFTVTPDANDPNTIHLKSLVKGVQPCWDTPQGRSQAEEMTLQLPFSGEYSVTYGVTTPAGAVWGEPYTFNVSGNNFSMLSDEIWTNLAGGVDENGNGNPKVWVPMDRKYEPYEGSSPVGYMSHTDVMNDGSGVSDLKIGGDNWNMNWDPGFQSWLIPADDPYMGSSMTLRLDAQGGCIAEINRVDGNGPSTKVGKFNLNVTDPARPLISFSNCEMLHAAWGDGVCSNYFQDLKIIECTPYVLQIATMRTNDEGAWWIVWNFVSKDVQDGTVQIPTGEPDLVQKTPVQEPTYDDLKTALFTISGSDVSYVATATTYLLNEEKPYDFRWWNPGTAAWEWINGYGSTWAPAVDGDEFDEFALKIDQKGNYELSGPNAADGKYTIEGNKLVFDKEITFLASGTPIKAQELTVMKASADDNEMIFGVPTEMDETGAYNRYLCLNMTVKAIGGPAGPTEIKFSNEKFNEIKNLEANKYLRIPLYNQYAGKDDSFWAIDPSKVKLRKGQSMTLKFSVSGINWLKEGARYTVCTNDNLEGYPGWDAAVYDQTGIPFVQNGENTYTITNNSGSTYNMYNNGAMEISIELDGYAEIPADLSTVTVTFTSITIQ